MREFSFAQRPLIELFVKLSETASPDTSSAMVEAIVTGLFIINFSVVQSRKKFRNFFELAFL
jgi:hypothetical protein